jgi:threonine dehydratase
MKRFVSAIASQVRSFITVNSGANMTFDRLRHVAERADLGGEREALFAVEIPERAGTFLQFCELIGNHSVTEFNYRYASPAHARILVGLSLERPDEKPVIAGAIAAAGFKVTDMSRNEMAKLHVRYMVGGHAPALRHERLFRFEFPERPGALLNFLQAVGASWNITLFHYRNHGSAYGRVLAGIEVPPPTEAEFLRHLQELGFSYAEETENPAYRAFLRESA